MMVGPGFMDWSVNDPDIDLTTNFRRSEFSCGCGGDLCPRQRISIDLVGRLQDLRDIVDEPIVVNSGFRCPKHNAAVKGSLRSRHMEGLAADIALNRDSEIDLRELAVIARDRCGFGRIGTYETWIHLDVDRSNVYFWYGKGVVALPPPTAAA